MKDLLQIIDTMNQVSLEAMNCRISLDELARVAWSNSKGKKKKKNK
jgi:hypothetical protein